MLARPLPHTTQNRSQICLFRQPGCSCNRQGVTARPALSGRLVSAAIGQGFSVRGGVFARNQSCEDSKGRSFAGARDIRGPLPYAIHGHVALRGELTYHHDAASVQAGADRNSASRARRTFPDKLREMATRR